MSVVPYGGARGLLRPVEVHRDIELNRQLQADPDAVMEAVQAQLEWYGCTCQRIARHTLAFDGSAIEGFITRPVRGATVTLDLSNPARAALRLDARMSPGMVYGWVVAVCLAVAFVPDLSFRILFWVVALVVGFLCRTQPLDTIEGAILDAVRRATEAARLPASTQQTW